MREKALAAALGVILLLGACGSSASQWSSTNKTASGRPKIAIFAPNTPRPFPMPRRKPGATYPPASVAAAAPAPRPVTRPAPRPAPVARSGGYTKIRVHKGDTVYAIARRHGTSPKAVITANSLRRPYGLKVGQRLRVPAARSHVVARGDTGYSVSRRYGVDLTAMMRMNRIGRPYRLRVGQVLKLPRQTRTPIVMARNTSKPSARANSSRKPTPPLPPRSGAGFAWPAHGKVISAYGSKAGGLHNDGINIRLESGAPVRASDAGTVVYTGNELKGFGNLVLIRHTGGWVSAYGHNQTVLVDRGDQVRRGQTISRAGATGNVGEPQLHFELRKGSRAVDPQSYLPPLRAWSG